MALGTPLGSALGAKGTYYLPPPGIATLPAGSVTDLGSVGSNVINVTAIGSPTITSFGNSAQQGQIFWVNWAANITLTYNATSLIIPGGANVLTAAGDASVILSLGFGNFQIFAYSYGNSLGGGSGGGWAAGILY